MFKLVATQEPDEDDADNLRHDEKVLDVIGLDLLMDMLGHKDDRGELQLIMREWDVHEPPRGYLNFDAFVSVISTYMKVEQLDQQVEEDFLTICGLDETQIHSLEIDLTRRSMLEAHRDRGESHAIDVSFSMVDTTDSDADSDGIRSMNSFETRETKEEKQGHSTDVQPENEITIDNLWNAIQKYGPTVWGNRKTRAITLDDVEEMVFDADCLDQSGDMGVSLDELLNILEMVATEEIKDEMTKSKGGMIRVPTGRHLKALMKEDTTDPAVKAMISRARRGSKTDINIDRTFSTESLESNS